MLASSFGCLDEDGGVLHGTAPSNAGHDWSLRLPRGTHQIQTFLVSILKVKERDLPDEGVEQELVVLLSLVAGGGVYQLYKSIIAEVE